MYDLDDYRYELPPELIAQQPLPRRDGSRLMVVDRRRGHIDHRRFVDLPQMLRAGDVLVVNDTAVVPARLVGRKPTGGRVEVLLLDVAEQLRGSRTGQPVVCRCLLRSAKHPRPGTRLDFGRGVQGTVLASDGGRQQIAISGPGSLRDALSAVGRVPLPPYIRQGREAPQDRRRYQTVYASAEGAVAAPTAGLHFSPALIERLKAGGVQVVALTLHVGYGTFAPVRESDIRRHRMHAEAVTISAQAAVRINAARDAGGRVVAVGTTSVRSLEFAAGDNGRIRPVDGSCGLFIYPGYRFRAVDMIITNFHLPGSTLLMLVAAFAGHRLMLDAYAAAVRQRYRFYSYGDAMLVL